MVHVSSWEYDRIGKGPNFMAHVALRDDILLVGDDEGPKVVARRPPKQTWLSETPMYPRLKAPLLFLWRRTALPCSSLPPGNKQPPAPKNKHHIRESFCFGGHAFCSWVGDVDC